MASIGLNFDTISRILGSALFIVLILKSGHKLLNPVRKPFLRALLIALPCLVISVNNLPIIALATGKAWLTADNGAVWLFAAECFLTALFEETAFRGYVLPSLLKGTQITKKRVFWSIIATSGVFSAAHLFNLFAGAGIGDTILQLGYTFLLGGMWSVLLLKTKNLWLCVTLHAVYNFCGLLITRLGDGALWDMPTIIITVIISLAVAAYTIWLLTTITEKDIKQIVPVKESAEESATPNAL